MIALFMWFFTKPDYEFGLQTVKLASLGRRGIARLIDLCVIGVAAGTIGWLGTRHLDWISLVEARNLHVDHPSAQIAATAFVAIIACLIVSVVAMIVAQGICGVTPGKWICGLRTLRTNLRPCGFARSLAREIVFFVDCGNFFCWTPGIVSIAVTDRRQRLGDLVADTIVVESRS